VAAWRERATQALGGKAEIANRSPHAAPHATPAVMVVEWTREFH